MESIVDRDLANAKFVGHFDTAIDRCYGNSLA
jgi:hypothetical protein